MGTDLIVAEFDLIVEHIDWIVVDTDLSFVDIDWTVGDTGSTFAGIGSIVVEFDSIVEDTDLKLVEFEHDFHCIAGYNFGFDGFDDNFSQMKLLEQSQLIPVLRILHIHIRQYCRSWKSHSSFDHVRKALVDGMISRMISQA